MSIYSRIFATTSKRLTSAASSGRGIPPLAFWAAPGAVAFTWFIWGALTDEIKQSVGLYYDPDAVIKRVEMERTKRLEAKGLLKKESQPSKDDEDEDEEEEEEDEEEEVTAETIEAVVKKAVKASEEDEEEDDDDEEDEEKPKKPKVDFSKLTMEEKWEYFAEKSTIPGEDDEDEDGDDDDDDDDE